MQNFDLNQVTNFVALGGTYAAHRDGETAPRWPPNLWTVPEQAIVPEGEPITIPPYTEDVVLGPELAVIIGHPLWQATEREAQNAIKGFTISNDITTLGEFPGCPHLGQDDHSGRGFKIFPSFNPTLAKYEMLDVNAVTDLRIQASVDNEVVVDASTANMGWRVSELIKHVSKIVRLEENDIVSLGEPSGTTIFIDQADQVTCEIDGIGSLRNPVERR